MFYKRLTITLKQQNKMPLEKKNRELQRYLMLIHQIKPHDSSVTAMHSIYR